MRAKGAPREISQKPPRLTLRPPIDPRRRPPRRRDERAKQAIFKIAGMTCLIHIGNDLLSPSRRLLACFLKRSRKRSDRPQADRGY
jgi:hypothetical protein